MKINLSILAIIASVSVAVASNSYQNIPLPPLSHTVYTTYTDSLGLLWVGTSEGLYTYDGYDLRPAYTHGTASNTHIHQVLETDSVMYVASDNGLLRLDKATFKYLPMLDALPDDVRALALMGDDMIVGSLNGLYLFTPSSGQVVDISESLPHQAVYTICVAAGACYIGTYDGLAIIDTPNKQPKPYDPGFARTDKNIFVNSIAPVGDDAIAIGTEGALYIYYFSGELTEVSALRGNSVKSTAAAEDGAIYVATDNGLYHLSNDGDIEVSRHDSRYPTSLPNNIIWNVQLSPTGHLWISTDYGLSHLVAHPAWQVTPIEDITGRGDGNVISCINTTADGTMWLGGNNGLIAVPDTPESKARWYRPDNAENHIPHNNIRDITEDREGVLWIATDHSILSYDAAKMTFNNYYVTDVTGRRNANWAYKIVDDGKGRLWIGSYLGGVFVVDKNDLKASSSAPVKARKNYHGEPFDYPRNLAINSRGDIFGIFYSSPDIVRFNPETLQTTTYRIAPDREILPQFMAITPDNTLWLACRDGIASLTLADATPTLYSFPVDYPIEPLAFEVVGDDLWLSTTAGVWAFNTSTHRYSRLPLPDERFTAIYYEPSTSVVTLGGVDRVLTINTESVNANAASLPTIVVTDVLINGKRQHGLNPMLMSELHLAPDQRVAELHFSDLTYTGNDTPRRYEYRVKGASDAYTMLDVSDCSVTLSDLHPGKYVLQLRAVGSETDLLALPIVVEARWFATTQAKVCYALIAILIIAMSIVYLRRRERRRRDEQVRVEALERTNNRIEFLTNISHELKTPLSMVIGPVSNLLATTRDPSIKESLRQVHQNALNLNSMLHKALEINRLNNDDDLLIIKSQIDIIELAHSVFQSYCELNPSKHFIFAADCPALTVKVDVAKMESIFNNLLSNAVKYSPAEATIVLSLSMTDQVLSVRVADDGVGIPEPDRALVFQRLFRSTNTASEEGTGIGLYLTKKYVTLHGGEIGVEDNDNQGTVFWINFPLESLEAQIDDSSAAQSTSEKNEMNMTGADTRPVILVVEDNMSIADFISSMLKEKYRCVMAHDGRAALTVMSTLIPDVIVADIMMPVMDGIEMLEKLKSNQRLCNIPVIIVSAKDDPDTQRRASIAGAEAFFAKPFDAPLLVSRIDAIVNMRSQITRSLRAELLSTPEQNSEDSCDEKIMKRISRHIDEHIADSQLSVQSLADAVNLSTKQLYRLVKKYAGVTPVDLIRTMRLRKAAILLQQGNFTVAEVMYMTGFSSASYFAKCFTAHYGVSPRAYGR